MQITASQLNTCKRTADYLKRTAGKYLADIYDKSAEAETKRNNQNSYFIEFYIIFYPALVKRFDNKMRIALEAFSSGDLSANDLKTITDEYIKAHTVVWLDGVPHYKVNEQLPKN